MARYPQSGKPLRALHTTLLEKSSRGTRLIAGNNSNKCKDWEIRDTEPKPVMIGHWFGLNDYYGIGNL